MSEQKDKQMLDDPETGDTPIDASDKNKDKGPGVFESPTIPTTTTSVTSQTEIVGSVLNTPTIRSEDIPMMTSTPITKSSAAAQICSGTQVGGSSNTTNNGQGSQQQSIPQSSQEWIQILSRQRENIELQNKSFESMKALMGHIQKTSENFLAAERLRIQGVRGNILNSTDIFDETQTRPGIGVPPQSSSQDINIEVTKALNDSLTALKTTLESNNKKANYQVPRKYQLGPDADITIWMDKLKTELIQKDLIDVIDSTVTTPSGLDAEAINRRKQTVREIITSHLDDKYYKKVLMIKDPVVVIEKLKEARRVENNVTHASVRAKLYQMRLQPKESIDHFWNRFDNTIVEYENCDNAVPLTDEEKRSSFYQAVCNAIPDIRIADLTHRRITKRSMTLEELKSCLLEMEAEKKSGVSQEQGASAHQAKRLKVHHDKCHRCNQLGHYMKQCPLITTGQWYCYICKAITNHNAKTCINYETGTQKSSNFESQRGRGRGRTRSRSAFGRCTTSRGGFSSKSRGFAKNNRKAFGKQAVPPKDGENQNPQARQVETNKQS
ncbi:uncharacterized protein LOC141525762 isoform X2 [Cotesia typhae]|uniref:uncharacterized protein LOC141525762 isoform X2 n=1 Tax=Cotesia typhae TaxID=2053667 RepID=UPI003D69227E